MIINDFNICRAFLCPAEANAELIIYPNAVLALAFVFERFQAIARWRSKERQCMRSVKLSQLPGCDTYDLRKPLALTSFKQRLRVGTAEAINHSLMLERACEPEQG